MLQDENENSAQYTGDYHHENTAQHNDAVRYPSGDQPLSWAPEQHDQPTARSSGHYAVPSPQSYPSQQALGSNQVLPQQSYASQPTTEDNQVLPQPNYGGAPATYNSYPTSGQQGHWANGAANYPPQTQQGYVPQPPRKARGLRTGAIVALTLVLLLIFGVGLYAGWQFGGNTKTAATTTTTSSSSTKLTTIPDTSTVQGQQEAAIAAIEPSVVELDVTTSQGEDIGSGVIIDSSGDIITNNHVVAGAQSMKVVLSNGKTETAQLVGTSASNDLAIVHIQPFTNMTVATIGDSSKLIVGQEVLAVGNPLGITQTATRGIVSALNRSVQESSGSNQSGGGATINGAIQTDAPINPGNSGGALINLQGQLIGIPTLAAVNTESNTNANGIGFAIPSSTVKTVIAQILNK